MTVTTEDTEATYLISYPGLWDFWYSEIGCFQNSGIKNSKNLSFGYK